MEAAAISPAPSPANEALVRRAEGAIRGRWAELAAHATGRPQYATLQPFLATRLQANVPDRWGRTPLCAALQMLDVAAVRAALEGGADPKLPCEGKPPIRYLVFMAMREDGGRAEIARLLRAHGAVVEPRDIESCRSPAQGACATTLLPVLER
jgi:hypothetical protein